MPLPTNEGTQGCAGTTTLRDKQLAGLDYYVTGHIFYPRNWFSAYCWDGNGWWYSEMHVAAALPFDI